MNDHLRQVFPPRRDSRSPSRWSPVEDARWANTLDWRNNDCDLISIFGRLADGLDFHYRQFGLRLDQLIDSDEFSARAKRAALWYRRAKQQYTVGSIYDYLQQDLDRILSRRAMRLIDVRRRHAQVEVLTSPVDPTALSARILHATSVPSSHSPLE